jgi:hypothetical protein
MIRCILLVPDVYRILDDRNRVIGVLWKGSSENEYYFDPYAPFDKRIDDMEFKSLREGLLTLKKLEKEGHI